MARKSQSAAPLWPLIYGLGIVAFSIFLLAFRAASSNSSWMVLLQYRIAEALGVRRVILFRDNVIMPVHLISLVLTACHQLK
jgi:hypothetical protein